MLRERDLDDLLRDAPGVIDEALAVALAGVPDRPTLADMQLVIDPTGAGLSLAALLLATLKDLRALGGMESVLRQRGLLGATGRRTSAAKPSRGAIGDLPMEAITQSGFNLEKTPGFVVRALAFRCRILVGNVAAGSGALVSPRLVLTAAHVVESMAADAPSRTGLKVWASDGLKYAAHVVWSVGCHPDEHNGRLPPKGKGRRHFDAALLQLDRPLGRMLGTMDLPPHPVVWTGTGHFGLVHFPKGREPGWAPGAIRRTGPKDERQFHNVNTDGGSSGGPGFDNEYTFLGLHQGRWAQFKRIVPYDLYADDPQFCGHIQNDHTPDHPWSLDGSLEGVPIIGRSLFYDALQRIVDGKTPMLRGIWVRRGDQSTTHGLAFSHHMLKGFLGALVSVASPSQHRVFRLAPELASTDLIGTLATTAGLTEPVAPHGTTSGQATAVTVDRERAAWLAAALQAAAVAQGMTTWIYFDNPTTGLTTEMQTQLEHLVAAVLAQPQLRLVLAGMETYRLVSVKFARPEEASDAPMPGVLVELIGHFTKGDVLTTAGAVSRGLGLNWSPDVIDLIVDRALHGIPPGDLDRIPLDHLEAVGKALLGEAAIDFRRKSRAATAAPTMGSAALAPPQSPSAGQQPLPRPPDTHPGAP